MSDIIKQINESLEKIRPSLQSDGGDIEFIDFNQETGIVKLKFIGMCDGCPMAQITMNEGIAMQLKEDVPEVKEVEAV